MILIDKGRELGEKSGILIKNGVFKGLGFFDLNYQINKIQILENIITPMEDNANTTFLIESHLRKGKVAKIVTL